MMQDNRTEKIAKELESERGRQIQRAIAEQANQFEKDFYAALRELGYRINNASQLHSSKFKYDKKIIPVFKEYLKRAESVSAYYHIGGFSNYVQLMLFCVASPKLKEMTPFMVERYMFAVKNKAPTVILETYAKTICEMQDKKYLPLYQTLLEDEYLSFATSAIIAVFSKLKVYDVEDRLIELLEYRAKPILKRENKYREADKAFYAIGNHLNVCYASIKTLGHAKSKKALPYIQKYLTPENKVERNPFVSRENHRFHIKTLRKAAERAMKEISIEDDSLSQLWEFIWETSPEYLLSVDIENSGILEQLMEEFPETMSKTKRIKAFKEKLKAMFFVEGQKYPRWIQDSEWPLSKTGKPTKFLRQKSKGEVCYYYFQDMDTCEEIEIMQAY